MKPYVQDSDFTLYNGDALEVLRGLPDECVHLCATSPPFYGLRDYDVEGQIGLEDTPEGWVENLVAVFAEARRMLHDDGSLWVECGDTYAANPGKGGNGPQSKNPNVGYPTSAPHRSQRLPGIKPKDLIGTPFMLAFALRKDGWWWRGTYPWHKPNAMPESAKDRCTTNHSYIFHFTKSARSFFDYEAIEEPASWDRWGDQTTPKYEGHEDKAGGWIKARPKAELIALGNRSTNGQKPRSDERRGFDNRLERADGLKHPRSVWAIPIRGYSGAHFATWPEALAERIIRAGCPEGGTVLDPFGGSGTTALVARRLNRRAVLVELNEDYCELAARRVLQRESKQLPADLREHQDGTLNLFAGMT